MRDDKCSCTHSTGCMCVGHCTTRAGSHVWNKFEVFVTAVARVCILYSGVVHVCICTMLDSTTLYFSHRERRAAADISRGGKLGGAGGAIPMRKYHLSI